MILRGVIPWVSLALVGARAATLAAMLDYREGHDVDLVQLAELFRSVGWGPKPGGADALARMVKGSLWVVSAWEGARLVGFVRAMSDGVTTAYVTSVVVAEDVRHRGIATELIRRLLAEKDDVQFVLRADPPLHPFYRSLGFGDPTNVLVRPRRA